MPKVVFFGTDQFSVPSLRALIEKKIEVAAVVTKPDAASGRGKKLIKPPVAEMAEQNGIMVFQPEKLDEKFIGQLKQIGADIGVLVSYGKILPKEIIDIFPHGIVNVHPSLLPKYRGPSPIESAILNGDTETGVSLMKLDSGMDSGSVYLHESVNLNNTETRPEAYRDLSELGAKMLTENLDDIVSGRLNPKEQNDDDVSISKLISKADGFLDKEKLNQPAENIERMVRAYKEWPAVRLEDNSQIIEAKIASEKLQPGEIRTEGGRMLIGTATNAIEVVRLKPAGRNEMSVEEYLRGAKN